MNLLRDWVRGPLRNTALLGLGAALGAPATIIVCQLAGIWPG